LNALLRNNASNVLDALVKAAEKGDAQPLVDVLGKLNDLNTFLAAHSNVLDALAKAAAEKGNAWPLTRVLEKLTPIDLNTFLTATDHSNVLNALANAAAEIKDGRLCGIWLPCSKNSILLI
jgi:hypothetical protein